jgi:hypothetical protein
VLAPNIRVNGLFPSIVDTHVSKKPLFQGDSEYLSAASLSDVVFSAFSRNAGRVDFDHRVVVVGR